MRPTLRPGAALLCLTWFAPWSPGLALAEQAGSDGRSPSAGGSESQVPLVEKAAKDRAAEAKAHDDKALGDGMEATLRKAGFTDLQILPNSILVRAKDKAGNPVAMVLNPNSMTEVVTLDPQSGSAAGGNGARTPLTGSGTFVTILPSERIASVLIGLKVRGADNEELATIKDLAIDHDGLHAYILAAGGMLGIGDRFVAVAPNAIILKYDQVANTYAATMKATAEQLKAAPPFAYDGPLKAGRD